MSRKSPPHSYAIATAGYTGFDGGGGDSPPSSPQRRVQLDCLMNEAEQSQTEARTRNGKNKRRRAFAQIPFFDIDAGHLGELLKYITTLRSVDHMDGVTPTSASSQPSCRLDSAAHQKAQNPRMECKCFSKVN